MARPKKVGSKKSPGGQVAGNYVEKNVAKVSSTMRRKRTRTDTAVNVEKVVKRQRVSVIPEKLQVPRRINRGKGVVLTLGEGDVGQLGLGEDITERKKPALVSSLTDVVDVSAGGMHTVCLTDSGHVYTFGCNDEGALGREGDEFEARRVDVPGKVVQISAGDSHTAALTEDGRLFVWGNFRVCSSWKTTVAAGRSADIQTGRYYVLKELFSITAL